MAERAAPATAVTVSRSPAARAWGRFKRNRIGYASFRIVLVLIAFSLAAPLISNEHPLLASYQGKLYMPILSNPPETEFGGDFPTPTDWLDPFIEGKFAEPGNWALFTLRSLFRRYDQFRLQGRASRHRPRPRTGSEPTIAAAMSSRGSSMAFSIGIAICVRSDARCHFRSGS